MQRQLKMRVFAVLLLAASVAGEAVPTSEPAPAPTVSPTEGKQVPTSEPSPAPTPAQKRAASDTTTEAPGTTKPNFDVLTTIIDAIQHELKHSSFPLVVGGVALIFGLIMLIDGEKSFNSLVTFAIAVVFGILSKQAVLQYWQNHHAAHSVPRHLMADVVGLEVGLVAAAAAHKGFKGVVVVIGAALGFCIASFVSGFLQNMGFNVISQVEVATGLYSVCAMAMSVVLYKDKHLGLLAVVSPLVGGVFVSSSILYFTTELFHKFGCSKDGCAGGLQPKPAPWFQFFVLAFKSEPSAEQDVGVFANSKDNFDVQGRTVLIDQLVIVVLWILLWFIGMKIQLKRHKAKRSSQMGPDAKAKPPAAAAKTGGRAKAREVLSEALLQHEV